MAETTEILLTFVPGQGWKAETVVMDTEANRPISRELLFERVKHKPRLQSLREIYGWPIVDTNPEKPEGR